MKTLAAVYRGDQLESFHTGSIAVVDANGRLLASVGDPALRTCLRSSAKPFQAIPLLQDGGADEFELSAEEIALTCASHGGEDVHVVTAAALLRKGELDETDLECGAHAPFSDKAAADLRASGEPPSPLHNNCSGKHAGMLLVARQLDAPTEGYIAPAHPVQERMLGTVAAFAAVDPAAIPLAVDGCGVPAFYLPLYRAALAYARLMAVAEDAAAVPELADSAAAASLVVDAMTACPYYVAGSWSMTTPLMQAFRGGLLAKEGAEGFYAMAISSRLASELTDRLQLDTEGPIGIALKVHDGSMGRGRNPVILRLLEQLGLDPFSAPEMHKYREWAVRNVVGKVVGEIRSEFELEFV